jgi:hypothetical protein
MGRLRLSEAEIQELHTPGRIVNPAASNFALTTRTVPKSRRSRTFFKPPQSTQMSH